MIILHCCGETYRADEKHHGFSIRCTVCGRIIPIGKSDSSTLIPFSPKAIYQRATKPFRTKHSFVRTWAFPILGIVALVVGLSLTFASLRRRTEAPSETASFAESPTPNNVPNIKASNTPGIARPSPSTSPPQALAVTRDDAIPLPTQYPISTLPDPVAYPYGAIHLATPIPTIAPPSVRYETGANLIRPQDVGGRCVLKISNNTDFDAIVKLSDNTSGRPARSVYIRAYENAEINRISAGNYTVKFALGFDYNPASGLFNRPQTFKKFDDPFEFREYEADGYNHWTTFEISLNPIVGGTAQASPINEREFRNR